MSKHCPHGGYVVYLDCQECDDKICKGGKKLMAKNKIVIGIDQSYEDTGITIAYNRNIMRISEVYLKSYKNNTERRKALRIALLNAFNKASKQAKKRDAELICIFERIRVQNAKFFSSDYLIQMGALNSVIVDTAYEFNIPTFSVDTRSWKARIVGTSKPMPNEFGIDPNKWPTIQYLIAKGYEGDLLKAVSNRKTKGVVKTIDGVKYTYNDNKADSACIALYGFNSARKLTEEH